MKSLEQIHIESAFYMVDELLPNSYVLTCDEDTFDVYNRTTGYHFKGDYRRVFNYLIGITDAMITFSKRRTK